MRLWRVLPASLLAVAASAASGDGARSPSPHALTQAEIGTRLRVFAAPGDFALSNDDVTAVVRKQDGWLTELWRNRPILPTTEQLGTLTDIDGLWQMHPIVRVGGQRAPVLASRVAALSDGVEVEGTAEHSGVRFRAVTVHRLHPTEPKLVITTTFSVEGGGPGGPVELGDELKWGNTTYHIEGLFQPRSKFAGEASWIGRKGAGGDLMLRPLSSEKVWVDYEASSAFPGFQGAIAVLYARQGIPIGGSVTIRRELSFEPLPLRPAATPSETGVLEISVRDENDAPIAAKVRVDRGGQKTPLFEPEGGLAGADRFLWTGSGKAERTLAAGQYKLLITSGIERDAVRQTVLIRAGKTTAVAAKLPRVVSTPGWVAADLHLHQAPSVDADVGLPERVVAIAAEGIEFAVATDHYVVTDLQPTVQWMKERGALASELTTMAGCEVSTLGNRFGHFNVFPLGIDQRIDSVTTTPSALFADARAKSPDGVLQVNHPRWAAALGYFTAFELDRVSGRPGVKGYDPGFDTLEVYNGLDAHNLRKVRPVLEEWIRMLGRGQRYTATGSSDSHNLAFLDPGLPRTMIRWKREGSDDDDARAAGPDVLAALKAGNAVVTSGPIIDASIEGAGPGETARGVGSKAKLKLTVRAAPWIDVRSVEILQGGDARRVTLLHLPAKKTPVRLDRSIDLFVKGKTFFVITARGDRMLPNASREGTVPFAFTNPIWVEP